MMVVISLILVHQQTKKNKVFIKSKIFYVYLIISNVIPRLRKMHLINHSLGWTYSVWTTRRNALYEWCMMDLIAASIIGYKPRRQESHNTYLWFKELNILFRSIFCNIMLKYNVSYIIQRIRPLSDSCAATIYSTKIM